MEMVKVLIDGVSHEVNMDVASDMLRLELEAAGLRKALEYIATYRFGFDGTEAGRLGLYAHNQLGSVCETDIEE